MSIRKNIKHGLTKHPLYKRWGTMRQRCSNYALKCYADYGGRGIKVCKEWDDNFYTYYQWAIANGWEKGLDVDRIDNDGDYEPSNCRFVTRAENSHNKRNNIFTWEIVNEIRNGEYQPQKELAKKYNCPIARIGKILNNTIWIDEGYTRSENSYKRNK